MKIALETSKRRASLSVEKAGEVHFFEMAEDERQSSHLLTMVKSKLESLDIKPSDVESFILHIGPGSSTGLRMGIAMAQGWAAVFPKVIFKGIHLESMALELLNTWKPAKSRAYLLADAFAGQVFVQSFIKDGESFTFEGELKLIEKGDLESLEKDAAIIDDLGFLKEKIDWPSTYEWSSLDFPNAKWVALGERHHSDADRIEEMDVRYLKVTSAELNWNKRKGI